MLKSPVTALLLTTGFFVSGCAGGAVGPSAPGVPSVTATAPGITATAPGLAVTAPGVALAAPTVGVTTPAVGIAAPAGTAVAAAPAAAAPSVNPIFGTVGTTVGASVGTVAADALSDRIGSSAASIGGSAIGATLGGIGTNYAASAVTSYLATPDPAAATVATGAAQPGVTYSTAVQPGITYAADGSYYAYAPGQSVATPTPAATSAPGSLNRIYAAAGARECRTFETSVAVAGGVQPLSGIVCREGPGQPWSITR